MGRGHRHVGGHCLRPGGTGHRQAPDGHAEPAGGGLRGAERPFHGLCRGLRGAGHADERGAAHPARHGGPLGLPARAGYAHAAVGAVRGARRERERHGVRRADPLRRQRYLGGARGLPHRCRPHGDPLGYRRAVHGEPADRSGGHAHSRRGSRRPRHPGCGRGRGVRRGKRRHDHEDQGGPGAHGRRHPHGHLPGAARGLHRSGRCRRGGRHAVHGAGPPPRDHGQEAVDRAWGLRARHRRRGRRGPRCSGDARQVAPFRGHSLRGGRLRVG